jgi:hypothetical protein
MTQISRLRNAEIANGNLINADDIAAELNQVVTESNTQDTRLTTVESGTFTQSGTLTTINNLVTNGLTERTADAGVAIDGTQIRDGYLNVQAIRASVSSIDTSTDVLTTVSAHGFSLGDALKIRAVPGGVLPAGLSASTQYYAKVITSNTLSLASSSANAIAGTPVVNITSTGSSTIHLIGTPANLNEGDLFADASGLKTVLGGTPVQVITTADVLAPTGYHGSAAPVYVSTTAMTLAFIRERDSSDNVTISKSTATTVDSSTIGLNGIAQSDVLVGTVSTMPALAILAVNATTDVITFSGSHGMTTGQPIVFKGTVPAGVTVGTVYWINNQSAATVTLYNSAANAAAGTSTGKIDMTSITTGATTDPTYVVGNGTAFNTVGANQLKAGDVIAVTGGETRKIISVVSDTQLILGLATTSNLNGVTYKRGGKAVSTASTGMHLFLYAISDGVTPGLILSTRNVAGGDSLVDLPTGYQTSRQLAFVVSLDNSGNIVPFRVGSGWPDRPRIILTQTEAAAGYYQLVSAFAVASFTTFNAGPIIPPISRLIDIDLRASVGGGVETAFYTRETGSGLTTGRIVTEQSAASYYVANAVSEVAISASQQIDFRGNNTGTPINVWVSGYTITEVN